MDKKAQIARDRHGVQLAAFLIAPALFATVFSALGKVMTAYGDSLFEPIKMKLNKSKPFLLSRSFLSRSRGL